MTSEYSVEAVLLLDKDGKRLFTKYYSPPHGDVQTHQQLQTLTTLKDQQTFEKGLAQKTHRQNGDVIIYDNKVVVYKTVVDVTLYVVGSFEENEVMLYQLVAGIKDALEILLKHSFDKRSVLEHFDLVALAIDEAVDSGVILEIDPVVIASRVTPAPAKESIAYGGVEINEQTISNVYQKWSQRAGKFFS